MFSDRELASLLCCFPGGCGGELYYVEETDGHVSLEATVSPFFFLSFEE